MQENRSLNAQCGNQCPQVFVVNRLKSVGNDVGYPTITDMRNNRYPQIIAVIHHYPPLFTKKKSSKKRKNVNGRLLLGLRPVTSTSKDKRNYYDGSILF
jgi:hypothetical protein